MRGALVAILGLVGAGMVLVGVLAMGDARTQETAPAPETTTPARPSPGSVTQEPTTSLETVPPLEAVGAPLKLEVPRLGITAPVRRIAVVDGVLTPPADAREVGWDMATAPVGSAFGSSIITGHTVHTGGGALDELDDLTVGDRVFVSTKKGRIRYVVSSVSEFTKEEMVKAIPRLYSGDVPGRLVLITCTDWNGVDYDANTVVFARPA